MKSGRDGGSKSGSAGNQLEGSENGHGEDEDWEGSRSSHHTSGSMKELRRDESGMVNHVV